jgi:hypothetical protein
MLISWKDMQTLGLAAQDTFDRLKLKIPTFVSPEWPFWLSPYTLSPIYVPAINLVCHLIHKRFTYSSQIPLPLGGCPKKNLLK